MSGETHEPLYEARLMSAVAEMLSVLIEQSDFEEARHASAKIVGEATKADRVYIFEAGISSSGGNPVFSESYEWIQQGISFQKNNPMRERFPVDAFPHMLERFRTGQSVMGLTRTLGPVEKAFLEPQEILSFIFMPILIHGALWGFVGLDDCRRERVWSRPEVECIRAISAGLAGAIVRRQMEASYKAQTEELRAHRRAALSLAEDARRSENVAAQASVAKTTFLAMMSHEIRTPLNGVIGFTDLLLTEGLPDRQSEIAHAIKTCGETLLSLISDILDISKIESGKLELHPESVDVADCARSVLATFESATRKKGVDLVLTVAEDVPPWLWLDANRFCQILFNLLGNAVKFTAQGSIRLHLWLERPQGVSLKLHGKVSDTGLGMKGEELSAVFEPFLQGEGARRTASGGSGLGLAICRRLVEAMNGTISVTSQPGEGSEFIFSISVHDAEAPADRIRAATQPLSLEGQDKGKILVVDDVHINVRLVLSLLKRLGYSAGTASSGLQALQMVREGAYDLIFMDILMPEMDGHETARKIREAQRVTGAGRSWIVALTADALLENRQSCAEAGMDDFLTKPLRLNDIEGAIGRWKRGEATLKG